MTWSIIARDELTGQFGIAVATRFFAVGARVPHIAAGIGGIATQALVNPYYGIDGLKLLREGRKPRDIVETLIAADAGRESPQLHIMDAGGLVASHTGRDCVGWCGHMEGKGFSIAGNMLAGARVLDDTAAAYIANQKLPFARRLIAALRSGEAVGRSHRLDPLRRLRSARCARPDPAGSQRQPPGDDLPGADDLAQSLLYHR